MAMKKALAMLLIILGFCSLVIQAAAGNAPAAEYESGDYTYTVGADGYAVIIRYEGGDDIIAVPDALGGHTVTAIEDEAFPFDSEIVSVSLPSGIQSIGPGAFDGCYLLSSIEVAAGNPVYVSVDGVLFRKTDLMLIAYPSMKKGPSYSVPQGTLAIGDRAFDSCHALQTVALPDSVQSVGKDAFAHCGRLAAILVSPGNPRFASTDGALFRTADGALIAYPPGKTEDTYSVPQGTQSIGDRVFCECFFTAVTLPESLLSIGDQAFYNCRNLASVNLPDGLQTIGTARLHTAATSPSSPCPVACCPSARTLSSAARP